MIYVDNKIRLRVKVDGEKHAQTLFMNFDPEKITEAITDSNGCIVHIRYKTQWYAIDQTVQLSELKEHCKNLI